MYQIKFIIIIFNTQSSDEFYFKLGKIFTSNHIPPWNLHDETLASIAQCNILIKYS